VKGKRLTRKKGCYQCRHDEGGRRFKGKRSGGVRSGSIGKGTQKHLQKQNTEASLVDVVKRICLQRRNLSLKGIRVFREQGKKEQTQGGKGRPKNRESSSKGR